MSADADRKRVLERIEKCLNLAKSNEPHEAAAALRQAQKLMAAHGVTEKDVFGETVTNELIITPEPAKRKLPMYMSRIVGLIQRAFGVQALIEPVWHGRNWRMGIRYFGPKGRPQLAVYTHAIIWRQLSLAWNQYAKDNPWMVDQKGARTGFWIGWLDQVRAQVVAFGYVPSDAPPPKTEEEVNTHNALVVKLDNEMTLTKSAIEKYAPDAGTVKSNAMAVSSRTMAAGREAAKDFQLHRGVDGTKQRQLTKN